MSKSFERDGTWWHRRDDGVWLRWNSSADLWEEAQAGPPPPLPPSSSSEADTLVSNAPGLDGRSLRAPEEGPASDATTKRETAAPLTSRQDVIPESTSRSGLTFDLSGWIRNPILPALIAGVVLVTVGFVALRSFAGGDQEAVPPSGTPDVSIRRDAKAAFIEKADALCEQALVKMKNLPPATNAQQAARYVARTIAINQRLITRIRDLKFPTEDRLLLRRVLVSADEMIQAARGVRAAVARGDASAAKVAVERALVLQEKANELARRYGFDECSQSA